MPNEKLPNLCELLLSVLERALPQLTEPPRHSLTLSIATDLARRKSQLIAENALLRQQLIVLQRQFKRPHLTRSDRLWLALVLTNNPIRAQETSLTHTVQSTSRS